MSDKLSVEEKYKWLLSKLEITDPDLWEGDALIKFKQSHPDCKECRSLYVLLDSNNGSYLYPEMDRAIELAMSSEKVSKS